jgi:hypothetical protein
MVFENSDPMRYGFGNQFFIGRAAATFGAAGFFAKHGLIDSPGHVANGNQKYPGDE